MNHYDINLDEPFHDYGAVDDSIDNPSSLLMEEDFSLNSPIIVDDMKWAYGIKEGLNCTLEYTQYVQTFRMLTSHRDIKMHDMNHYYEMIWDNIIVHRTQMTQHSSAFKNISESLSSISIEVLGDFLRYIGDDCSVFALNTFKGYLTSNLNNPAVQQYIYKNEIWRLLVILINCPDDIEGVSKQLSEDYPFFQVLGSVCPGIIDVSIHGDEFTVGKGLVLAGNDKLPLNRCLVLMIKDIFLARRNTLIFCRVINPSHSFYLVDKLIELYEKGDLIIKVNGAQGYKAVKLLEPVCLNRLAELSEDSRDIPPVTNFSQFLESSIEDLQSEGILCKDFLDVVKWPFCPEDVSYIFGVYRHWGHPIINWEAGLVKLHHNVTMKKDIDEQYVNKLASDLAYKLIKKEFDRTGRFPVKDLQEGDPFFQCQEQNCWPSDSTIVQFGANWHHLNFTGLFTVPETFSLSDILDDKALSCDRDVLKNALMNNNLGSPSLRRVLLAFLGRENVEVMDLLKQIDKEGIPLLQSVIGLRAKERELKEEGRFFSLMTFIIRIYFVLTEMMIAEFILPVFPEITMTDDMTKVYSKMYAKVPGHGGGYPDKVTYAYHIDYEKWNNHQRYESTAPIFQVIDKALGFSNLITRTHEIFQNCLVYHANSPHLFRINESYEGENTSQARVCWNGQDGGFEGLRQKGWSVISLLMILDCAAKTHTKVEVLAQGDNQIICPSYKVVTGRIGDVRSNNLFSIKRSATQLIKSISQGAKKLGLLIKGSETWASSNFLVYGKNLLFNRKMLPVESKRLSRASCLNNDQLPTLKNNLSTVATTCLTIAQQSPTVSPSMFAFVILGREIIEDTFVYSPILNSSIDENLTDMSMSLLLFLDGGLGGLGGCSLNRFMIRQFPDGITESLSFWKTLHQTTDSSAVKELCMLAGNVELRDENTDYISKLIESPESLNLKRETEADNIVKDLIQTELVNRASDINNQSIRQLIQYYERNNHLFLMWLAKIRPFFPRFLSELFSSSGFGYTESIINLFRNSRTIRTKFSRRFSVSIRSKVCKSEKEGVKRLWNRPPVREMWSCSATYADELRNKGWGFQTIGCTAPHPGEYMSKLSTVEEKKGVSIRRDPESFPSVIHTSNCKPYLGSSTQEHTSLYKSWERKSEFHILKKPFKMQSAIGWFVPPEGNICKTMRNNLKTFSDVDVTRMFSHAPKRTGCAIHRFRSSRVSNGGFSPISLNLPSCIYLTSDGFKENNIDGKNYDFLYQATLIYLQTSYCERMYWERAHPVMFSHWSCEGCLREVEEIQLTNPEEFNMFPNFRSVEGSFIPKELLADFYPPSISFSNEEDLMSAGSQLDFSVGLSQAILLLNSIKRESIFETSKIFPVTIPPKMNAHLYFLGLLCGIYCFTLTTCALYSRPGKGLSDSSIREKLATCIYQFCSQDEVYSLSISSSIKQLTNKHNPNLTHDFPQSSRNFMKDVSGTLISLLGSYDLKGLDKSIASHKWLLFSEMLNSENVAPLLCWEILTSKHSSLTTKQSKMCKVMKESSIPENRREMLNSIHHEHAFYDVEIRHACKHRQKVIKDTYTAPICERVSVGYEEVKVECTTRRVVPDQLSRSFCGFRCSRTETIFDDSHYIWRDVLEKSEVNGKRILIVGEGSSGVAAWLISRYPTTEIKVYQPHSVRNIGGGGFLPDLPVCLSSLPPKLKERVDVSEFFNHPKEFTTSKEWKRALDWSPNVIIVNDISGERKEISAMSFSESVSSLVNDTKVFWRSNSFIKLGNDTHPFDWLARCFYNCKLRHPKYVDDCLTEVVMVAQQLMIQTTKMFVSGHTIDHLMESIKFYECPYEKLRRVSIYQSQIFTTIMHNDRDSALSSIIYLVRQTSMNESDISEILGMLISDIWNRSVPSLSIYLVLKVIQSLFSIYPGREPSLISHNKFKKLLSMILGVCLYTEISSRNYIKSAEAMTKSAENVSLWLTTKRIIIDYKEGMLSVQIGDCWHDIEAWFSAFTRLSQTVATSSMPSQEEIVSLWCGRGNFRDLVIVNDRLNCPWILKMDNLKMPRKCRFIKSVTEYHLDSDSN
uniref:RNA-directed RNA polymerase n=1 Tax=Beihai dimarhabodovirus 1 TaxID=2116357 RepID=A0A2P1GMT7_9RHAB|nr:L protein [Beihai dimarhabodovirus 1]